MSRFGLYLSIDRSIYPVHSHLFGGFALCAFPPHLTPHHRHKTEYCAYHLPRYVKKKYDAIMSSRMDLNQRAPGPQHRSPSKRGGAGAGRGRGGAAVGRGAGGKLLFGLPAAGSALRAAIGSALPPSSVAAKRQAAVAQAAVVSGPGIVPAATALLTAAQRLLHQQTQAQQQKQQQKLQRTTTPTSSSSSSSSALHRSKSAAGSGAPLSSLYTNPSTTASALASRATASLVRELSAANQQATKQAAVTAATTSRSASSASAAGDSGAFGQSMFLQRLSMQTKTPEQVLPLVWGDGKEESRGLCLISVGVCVCVCVCVFVRLPMCDVIWRLWMTPLCLRRAAPAPLPLLPLPAAQHSIPPPIDPLL